MPGADREEGDPAEAAVDEESAAHEHVRAADQALARGEQAEEALEEDPHRPEP